MSAALAEPLDAININNTNTKPSTARAEASRANGARSRGPTSMEGKERSRRNGCKDGLTGAGIVLPAKAAAEVERREAEFARDFRPRNAVERELVRQMALGAWRSQELTMRIVQHDARVNAARFAHWDQDRKLAALELGERLAENPETVVARLRRSTAGCDWLRVRWDLLAIALSTAEEEQASCSWTDADLALVLNLLGRPPELRHLDDWTGRLESLCAEAKSGSKEAVAELTEIIDKQVDELHDQSDELWQAVEESQLQAWQSGLEIDLGPEGTRLRRYAAAADGLFRSAWTKLERLRKERGEPLMPRSERGSAPVPAARRDPPAEPTKVPPTKTAPPAPVPAPPAPVPARTEPLFPESSLLGDPSPVLDFWIAGPPRPGIVTSTLAQNKTNPAPGRPANGATPSKAGLPPADGLRGRRHR
jgi:hypothetical protein